MEAHILGSADIFRSGWRFCRRGLSEAWPIGAAEGDEDPDGQGEDVRAGDAGDDDAVEMAHHAAPEGAEVEHGDGVVPCESEDKPYRELQGDERTDQ